MVAKRKVKRQVKIKFNGNWIKLPSWAVQELKEGRNCRYRFRVDGKEYSENALTTSKREALTESVGNDVVEKAFIRILEDKQAKNEELEAVKLKESQYTVKQALKDFESIKLSEHSVEQKKVIVRILRQFKESLLYKSGESIELIENINPLVIERAIPLLKINQSNINHDVVKAQSRKKITNKYWGDKKSYITSFLFWLFLTRKTTTDLSVIIPEIPKGQKQSKKKGMEVCWPDNVFLKVVNLLEPEYRDALFVQRYAALDFIDVYQLETKHILPNWKDKKYWWICKIRGKANGRLLECPIDRDNLIEIIKRRYKISVKKGDTHLFKYSNPFLFNY